jgi:ribosomal protein L7Ae-like RNA K-turn-binding protein
VRVLSLLGFAQASGNLVSGYNGCLATLRRGRVKLVIIATDASDGTKDTFLKAARGIPVMETGTMEQLGAAIGKSERAVLCILEAGMAQAIMDAVNTCMTEAESTDGRVEETVDHS